MIQPKSSLTLVVGLAGLLILLGAAPALAATYTVNTTSDPAGAGCTGGTCSLRQAIEQADASPASADAIVLTAGQYVLALGVLNIDSPVTITGAGARATTVDGNNASRVFYFDTGSGPSFLSGVAVMRGNSSSAGGIYNVDAVTITEVAVVDNTANFSTGGGIYNNTGATMTIDRSTISGNFAFTIGGGIYNQSALTITNSTISGNTANTTGSDWEGGGLYSNNGPATITNTTIAGNTADSGSGVDLGSGPFNIKNTIVAANMATGAGPVDCATGTITSLGNNLEDANTCDFDLASDFRDTPAGLGPLQDNGGPTDTRALLAGSAAINTGSNNGCPSTDQRGVVRPNGVCDIGAYEFAPPILTTGAPSAIDSAGGTLVGTVLPNFRGTTFHFDYGRTTAYGSATPVRDAGAGNSAVGANAVVTGLKSGTLYHHRLVATNAEGTTVGADGTFTTSQLAGATLVSRNLRVDRRGRVSMRLRCPSTTAEGCQTVAGIYVGKGKLPGSLSKALRLTRGKFSIAAGKTQTKRVRLNKLGRRLSKRRKTLRARLLMTTRDSARNAKTRNYGVKLKRR